MNFTVKEKKIASPLYLPCTLPKPVKGAAAHETANPALLLPFIVIYNSVSKNLTKPNMNTNQGGTRKYLKALDHTYLLNDIIMLTLLQSQCSGSEW
jgi:hypothetical protein